MTEASQDVWVFIEQRNNEPAEVSLELLSKGRKLADQLGSELKAIVIGHEADALVKESFRFGTDEVLLVDHPDLADYRTMPYGRILSELVRERQPRVVLFGATFIGRDVAPRVASSSRSGLTADCTDLSIGDASYQRKDYENLLLQIRPAFGGNIIATIITPDVHVQMATVREGVMEMAPLATPREGRVTRVPYEPTAADDIIKVIERHFAEKKADLKGASIIVAGGYGMKDEANFRLLIQLAELIGGEVAGSRAAVDAGFTTSDRQVGQTGVTVRPKLYIACGISGAIQHVAGMQGSNRIIAINIDPAAPIFDVCHYGLVADAMKVLPMMIETYKEKLR